MVPKILLKDNYDHYKDTLNILRNIDNKTRERIRNSSNLVIKPNFVSTYNQISATPLNTVKAILEYISKIRRKDIIIAEGPAFSDLKEGLKNYGYYQLKEQYNLEFIDLNKDDFEIFTVWNEKIIKKIKVRVAKTILESDFIISPVRPKTHDTVIVTLSIKNVVMGAVQKGYKVLMHQGFRGINVNIAYLAIFMWPSLTIIDGLVGMEGNGPINGLPISSNFILLSENPLVGDSITSLLMGFNPLNIGYLYYLWKLGFGEIDPDNVVFISEKNWKEYIREYKPHVTYKQQLNWKLDPETERKILLEIKEEINKLSP